MGLSNFGGNTGTAGADTLATLVEVKRLLVMVGVEGFNLAECTVIYSWINFMFRLFSWWAALMWTGGATGLTGSGLSLVGRLLGSREFAGYMWAAMIVWGGPVWATTVLLLVGLLWGRQGTVNMGRQAAGAGL